MQAGESIDGRYELVREIGAGGMGTVWEAIELSSDRPVAVKALHDHLIDKRGVADRFLREAKAALEARFSGHIVEVLDVVQPDDRPPYFVMELLEGEDLRQILDREGALEPRRAVDLIIQTCHALDEVHRRGLVHRDIKPGNLFVTRLADGSEWIKILDFGLVKFGGPATQGETFRPLTGYGDTLGTPHYMAPEQFSAPAEVNNLSDVYATGVVLYELLTGVLPFDDTTRRGLQKLLSKRRPQPLRSHRPELSEALDRVVLKAMAPNQRRRYQTIFAFAEALEPFTVHSDGSVSLSRPDTDREAPRAGIPEVLRSDRWPRLAELSPGPMRLGPEALLFIILGVVTIVAALAVLVVRSGDDDNEDEDGNDESVAAAIAGREALGDEAGPDDEERSSGGDPQAYARRVRRQLRKRLVKTLRSLSPNVGRCLKGTHSVGTKVLVHYWIGTDGAIVFRRSNPRVTQAARRCLKRAAKTKRFVPTTIPPFVATYQYRVPR